MVLLLLFNKKLCLNFNPFPQYAYMHVQLHVIFLLLRSSICSLLLKLKRIPCLLRQLSCLRLCLSPLLVPSHSVAIYFGKLIGKKYTIQSLYSAQKSK